MTVAELIKHLSQMPPDQRVVSRGYETGFDEVIEIESMKLVRVTGETEEWDGNFEKDDGGEDTTVLVTDRRL